MSEQKILETEIGKLYNKYRTVAGKFGYRYKRIAVSRGGLPCVIFLGNHSSGKSTFINYLLEGSAVQDTGVAPTDDGFTFLLYGEQERDVVGMAALELLPEEYTVLKQLGPNFLQRLRVRIRCREILKQVSLIDTPGMIDTMEKNVSRDYDFFSALRIIAEIADLVILMFDPDKPGTTGESIAALSGPLEGMTFKLRILMHKCDLFANMYDYARAYGALCWNLAHALLIKDIPKVYTCYVPRAGVQEKYALDVSDFDRLREEITRQIWNAAGSRKDNVLAAVHKDFSCLSMQIRMMLRLRGAMSGRVLSLVLSGLAVTALVAGGSMLFLCRRFCPPQAAGWAWQTIAVTAVSLLLTALAGWGMSIFARSFLRMYVRQLAEDLDGQFREAYRDELALDTRDDLLQYWELVKPGVKGSLVTCWRKMPLFGWGILKRIQNSLQDVERLAKENGC